MSGHTVSIGLDLGTTSAKALAWATDGRVVAEATERYGVTSPRPGYVEQDANAVYLAATRAAADTIHDAAVRGGEIVSIGFSSAMHGLVPVDERGEPLGPFLTWMDRRSNAIAQGWHEDGTGARLYQRTGAPMHPMLPLCKLRWLAIEAPDIFVRASRFVSMKELLVYRWTGQWLIDHGIASATGLFDLRARRWDDEALALAGVERFRLSEPAPPTTVLREIRAGVARSLGLSPTTAIVLCSSDGALANLGVGAVNRQATALTLGTSGAVRTVTETPVFDPQGRTFCYAFDDTRCLVGGPTSSAGGVFDWLCGLLLPEIPPERRFEAAVALAMDVREGADGLILLPFLSGERAPYWYGDLRGAFVGLDLSHDRRHLLRAALESIVYAVRTVSDIVGELTGPPHALLLSGGLTHSAAFRKLIADIFGIGTWLPNTDEASASGAAMMAAVAVNAVPGLDAVRALVTYPERLAPEPEARRRYEAVYRRYRQVVEAVLPLWHPEFRPAGTTPAPSRAGAG